MAHKCIVRVNKDEFAYTEQYLVQCHCHMDSYKTWRPGDTPIACPVSGDSLTVGIGRTIGFLQDGTPDAAV